MENEKINLKEHIEQFKKDESYIEYFREFTLENINMNPAYVKDILKKLLKESKKAGYKTAENLCLLYIGWCEEAQDNILEAIDFHWKSNQFFENTNEKRELGRTYNALLVDYQKLGLLDLAIQNGLKGINIAKEIEDEELMMALLINIASAYVINRNYIDAFNTIDRLILHNGFRINYLIESYKILSVCYIGIEDLLEAEKYCLKAIKLIDDNNYEIGKEEVLSIKAEILYRKGEREKAICIFKKSIEIAEVREDTYIKIKVLLRLADCTYEFEDINKAEEIYLKIIEELKSKEYLLLKIEVYRKLSRLYKKNCKYKEALNILEKYNEYKEKLYSYNCHNWISALKYNTISEEVQEYKELYNKIERISKIGRKITSNLDIEKAIYMIYDEVEKIVPTDTFGIALYEENKNMLNYKLFVENGRQRSLKDQELEEGKSLGVYCFNRKSELLINDITKEYSKYIYKSKLNMEQIFNCTKSIIYIPLIVNGKAIGVMSVQSYKKNAYKMSDLNELRILSSYIAIALENGKLFNKVNYLANNDTLTETLNRNEILKIGNKLVNEKYKLNYKLSIGMMDIDYFKRINDIYGHQIGDIILKDVAKIVKNNLRESDYIGRYGGEEFLILLTNTGINKAQMVGERIRKAVEDYSYELKNKKMVKVTVSLGFFEFDKPNNSFYEGIKKADKALYKAKEYGRNRVIISS